MARDVTGAEFRAIGLRLKAADEALLPLARRNIRVALAPVGDAIKKEALDTLPKAGGANEWVASSLTKISILLGPNTAGVKLTVTQPNPAKSQAARNARAAGNRKAAKSFARNAGADLKAINAGRLRHPLPGNNRDKWFTTEVRPGFFDRPVEAARPAVVAACSSAMLEAAHIAGFR